jgi:hypothetical protein
MYIYIYVYVYIYICICILRVSALLRPLPVWSPAAALLDGSGLRHHHGPLTLDTLQKSAKIPLEVVTRDTKKNKLFSVHGTIWCPTCLIDI